MRKYIAKKKRGEKKYPTIGHVLIDLVKRLKRIEEWIDLWETYDSGWTKYRKQKKGLKYNV